MTTPSRPPAGRGLLTALVVAVLGYSLAQTVLIPSLSDIQHHLHASATGATALLSAFFVSGAATAGLVGRLGDIVGKRRMLLVELVLFGLGAVVCALSTTLPVMLLGRVVMGMSAGVFPLSFSIIRDELAPEATARAVAIVGAVAGGGAGVGLVLGGVIADGYGYQWNFWLTVILAVLAIPLVGLLVPDSPIRVGGRLDIGGALLLGLGLAGPLIAISETPTWGWGGPKTLGLFALGAGLLVWFGRHESRHPNPLLDLPTLVGRNVALTNAATLLIGFGGYGASGIISQFTQEPRSTGYGLGVSATQAGLFLVPGAIGMCLTAPLAGTISARSGPRSTLLLGCGVSSVALGGLVFSHAGRLELYIWPSLMFLGLGFAFGAMPTLILEIVAPELRGQSTAVNLVLRNIGSSIGLQVSATVIAASVGATQLPSSGAYTDTFALEALGCGLAFALALWIPRRQHVAQVERSGGPARAL